MDHLVVIIVGALVVAALRLLERRKDKRPPVRSDNPHHPDNVRVGDVAWSMLLGPLGDLADEVGNLSSAVKDLTAATKRIESKVDKITAWRKP